MDVNHDKIWAQLERLSASSEFARTDRMARFLRFVVEKSLAGDMAALRERQIGIEVFDRPDDWDPKLDNIVRSEARRLRGKLDAYAESASPDETVRITMPKGGYAVAFRDLRPDDESGIGKEAAPPPPVLPAIPAGRRPFIGWRSTLLLTVSMAVNVISIFTISVWNRRGVQAKKENFEIVPFSTEVGQQFSPSVSPDGTRVAFVWNGDGTHFNIYIKSVEGGAPTPAPDSAPAESCVHALMRARREANTKVVKMALRSRPRCLRRSSR